MGKVQSYRDLEVWQRSMTICEAVYAVTKDFPREEMFGITNQIRRSAVSIASNIAEGHARPRKDFARFLSMSRGSLNELETQLEISRRVGFLTQEKYQNLTTQLSILGRQINALLSKLRG